jgi:hypothetical protein
LSLSPSLSVEVGVKNSIYESDLAKEKVSDTKRKIMVKLKAKVKPFPFFKKVIFSINDSFLI